MEAHSHSQTQRAMILAMFATLLFALVELVGGWWSASLALVSDAGHMFLDSLALSLAILAGWISQLPASPRHSYGWVRIEVMAGLANIVMNFLIVAFIVYEAVQRLHHPPKIASLWVIAVAGIGLIVNLVVVNVMEKAHQTINVRAALLHVMGDLLGSVAALAAGIGIYFTGWLPLDPILSLCIALIILVSTTNLLREVFHVLMEGAPKHVQIENIGRELLSIPGVRKLHDLHVWSISSHKTALSAHLELDDLSNWAGILETARMRLSQRFNIDHVTLQPELSGGLKQPHKIHVPIFPKS